MAQSTRTKLFRGYSSLRINNHNLEIFQRLESNCLEKAEDFGMLGRLFLWERQKVERTEQSSTKPDPRTYTGAGPGKSIVSWKFYNTTKHTIWYSWFRASRYHHDHHHVQEGLGSIPVPCILKMKLVHQDIIYENDQQDATVWDNLLFLGCSTCFERYFRLSSGASKLYLQNLGFVVPCIFSHSNKTPNQMQQSIVKCYCFVVQTLLNIRALQCPSSGARQTAAAASGFRMNVEVRTLPPPHS